MIRSGSAGHWGRTAAGIAFVQAALSFAFFVFLGVYAETVNHAFERRNLLVYAGALLFVVGVPGAFVAAGLAFRSPLGALTWLGVALELTWVAFAVWAMVGQAVDRDVDFLNNLPVYTLLAAGALAAALMPFLDRGRPRSEIGS